MGALSISWVSRSWSSSGAPMTGLNIARDQPRPPRVHELDRLGVVVLAVPVAIDAMRAGRRPALEQRGDALDLGVLGLPDHAQGQRQVLLPAQVGRAGLLHRVDELGQRDLRPPRVRRAICSSSSCERKTELNRFESAPAKPGACLLFQLAIR